MAKTKINESGYRVFEDSGKLFHRWVAGNKHSFEEIDGKEVHHIDGNKLNNEKDNLIVLKKEDHHDIHKHENRINFFANLIIILALIYFASLLLIYFKIIPEEMGLNMMRLAVLIILIIAIEIKLGFIRSVIRNPKEKIWGE